MRSTDVVHSAAVLCADVTRLKEWQTEQRSCIKDAPSVPAEEEVDGVELLEPQETKRIPINRTSRKM